MFFKEAVLKLHSEELSMSNYAKRESTPGETEVCAKALGWRAKRQVPGSQCSWVAETKDKGGRRWGERGGLGHILELGPCKHAQILAFNLEAVEKHWRPLSMEETGIAVYFIFLMLL